MTTKLIASTIRRLTDKEIQRTSRVSTYKWVTEGSFIWRCENMEIKIPSGFLCDGSSGGPDFGHGWLFHDYLYSTHELDGEECERKDADDIMIDILSWERAGYYALAVAFLTKLNPFWLFSKAWNKSGGRGVELLQEFVEYHDSNSLEEVPLIE